MLSREKIISDLSKSQLVVIPEEVLTMRNLKMLFLEGNLIRKLPNNLFPGLPNLMWLDLRNNMLESLPTTIAHHQGLENLLLSNNKLQKLPNELGLVPNLKALQLQNNPLIYPVRTIIEGGTKAIKNFLKEQYNIQYRKFQDIENGHRKTGRLNESERDILEEEKLVKVVEEDSEVSLKKPSEVDRASSYWNSDNPLSRESRGSRLLYESNREKNLDNAPTNKLVVAAKKPHPLSVKKIDVPATSKKAKKVELSEEPLKIIHTINKSDSKISLKSYFNKTGIKGTLDQIPENSLKEGWLNKLRILLNDQERILQQERNLRALSEWRGQHCQESTPKTFYDDNYVAKKIAEYPYDTDPAYSKLPSREELTSQLSQFLSSADLGNSLSKPRSQKSSIDMDRMITDLMEQLKEMGSSNNVDGNVSSSEMEHAEKQIKAIVKIHKELLRLKAANDTL